MCLTSSAAIAAICGSAVPSSTSHSGSKTQRTSVLGRLRAKRRRNETRALFAVSVSHGVKPYCPAVLSAFVPTLHAMPTTLEEITYEAGRSALADQESLVAGIRQRTGTLLAAHALVASFLGATTVRAQGLRLLGWFAVVVLVSGLLAAAVLLAPWRLKFAVDARELYEELYDQAASEAEDETLGWLAAAGYGYQDLRTENAEKVRRMSWLSGALGVLMVLQTLLWLAALAVD
jgi:hypothetical protein